MALLLQLLVLTIAYSLTPTFASDDAAYHGHIARQPLQHEQRATQTPSHFINSPLIYSKYEATTSTYRPNTYPHLTTTSGAWKWVGNDGWYSGFLPGIMYMLHDRGKMCPGSTRTDWLAKGRKWSEGVVPLEVKNSVGHDTGFLSYPFMAELKVNPNNATAKAGIKAFAAQLAKRFNPTVGCTQSWNDGYPHFRVIIDNMMNLEVLFEAADVLGGLDNYRHIATSHADKTAINHLRPDASSCHVVDYSQANGKVLSRFTKQGYSDSSTWSRGQAWGVYAFASMFSHTSDVHYLDVSRRMGEKWLARLAEDSSGVPNWDFDAPKPTAKDTSAAAIVSVGFLMLYNAETSRGNSTGATHWKNSAIKVLSATADNYFQTSPSWNSLLSGGTYNHPSSGNTGLVYGDYYFIKAGNMMMELGWIGC